MERPMVIKAINGGLSQQQIFTNVVIDPNLPYKATIRSKDASLSPYLNLEGRPIGTHHHHHQQQGDDSELSIFDAQKYFNETAGGGGGGGGDSKPNKIRVSPVESSLIGLDCIPERDQFPCSVPRFSSASSSVDGYSLYGRNYRTRSFHATPTASSEASWNSQTGLLTNPPGAVSVSVRNPSPDSGIDQKRKGSLATRKWLFGNRCPCYGRGSAQVDEKVSEPKTPSRPERQIIPDRAGNGNSDRSPRVSSSSTTAHQWAERREAVPANRFPPPPVPVLGPPHRVLSSSSRPFGEGPTGFTFPILSQVSSNSHKVALNKPPLLQDPPRESLEVFQPPSEPQQRRSFTFPASPTKAGREDDAASDASSDLFEIESFSTTTQSTSYPMYNNNNSSTNNRRDSLDEAAVFNARRLNVAVSAPYGRPSVEDEPVTPSVAATECYEPSEVSIDWSVVTAEGFDRGSTITSYSVSASEANYRAIMRHREGEKAAAAAGEKMMIKKGGGGGGLLTSCRCEKAVNVGPQPVRHVGMISNNYKPPLDRSHSARLSLPFAS